MLALDMHRNVTSFLLRSAPFDTVQQTYSAHYNNNERLMQLSYGSVIGLKSSHFPQLLPHFRPSRWPFYRLEDLDHERW
jgi:hypothetical protein